MICSNDYVACEYIEEAYPHPPLLHSLPAHRVHVRNIMSWFDKIFYQDVYLTLFYERALKRHIEKRGPDTLILKKEKSDQNKYVCFYLKYFIIALQHLFVIKFLKINQNNAVKK